MTTKIKIIGIVLIIIATFIGGLYLQDKASHYTVPAYVYGHEGTETHLFETPDGNIWAYDLNDYIPTGKEVKLNMLDMSPDGKDVTHNIILSINIDGVDVTTETEELE